MSYLLELSIEERQRLIIELALGCRQAPEPEKQQIFSLLNRVLNLSHSVVVPVATEPSTVWIMGKHVPEHSERIELTLTRIDQPEVVGKNKTLRMKVYWEAQMWGFICASVWEKELFEPIKAKLRQKASFLVAKTADGKYLSIVGVKA